MEGIMQRLSSGHPVRSRIGSRQANHLRRLRIMSLSAIMCMLSGPGSSQDVSELAFNNACRTCHTTRKGDDRLGPNLNNILGRKAGSLPSYNYSNAMKEAGFVWDEEKLERFIAHPDEVVPGNNMKPYAGLASPDRRAEIVAFLRSTGKR
jgi:cytochrome c